MLVIMTMDMYEGSERGDIRRKEKVKRMGKQIRWMYGDED